jgi:hypothetical protein
MCTTLRKDCKLPNMSVLATQPPFADSRESGALVPHIPREPQPLQPVYLSEGDVIVAIFPPEGQRRCTPALSSTDARTCKGKGSLSRSAFKPNPCRLLTLLGNTGAWRLRMNPLKFFRGGYAKITDGRYDRIINPKRMLSRKIRH